MSFTSYAFVALLGTVLVFRFTIGRSRTGRTFLGLLVAANVVFYGWHVPAYLGILLASTTVDYIAGLRIQRHEPGDPARRRWLLASIAVNLGILGFFKYTNFALSTVASGLTQAGLSSSWLPELSLVLPMGVSFYTFQSMSYTIDVYRGHIEPERRFWRFFLYVSFFGQLVAGPIVRARDFLYQIDRRRGPHAAVLMEGAFLLIRGYFMKVVVADNLAWYVDRYWAAAASPENSAVFSGLVTFLFSVQIFADFAGYSSIARGIGLLLGFRLPVNFNAPYIAASFSEFWTRWHITLSSWLRDYLYIPLGGNRISRARTQVNLLGVMLLGGLWHGAAMTFIVWGGVHGMALLIERALGMNEPARDKRLQVVWACVVQAVVLLAWIYFRADSTAQGTAIVGNVLLGQKNLVGIGPLISAIWFTLPIVAIHLRVLLREQGWLGDVGPKEKALWSGVMLYAILTLYGQGSPFIYFQF